MTERNVGLARFNGSNKEALLRDVWVTHGVHALMETMQTPRPLAPADRLMCESAGRELIDVENTFSLGSRLSDGAIPPREVFSSVFDDFTSLGEGRRGAARHVAQAARSDVTAQGAGVAHA
jgi:hypothetical protein